MNLAPITLFVYNRLWHTQQTIEALQKNELASESELFIYADGVKNEKLDDQVLEVRSYIKEVGGFSKVTIIERDKNWGLAANIIDGVTNVVNQYGKIIVMEDDLVTSPYFLKFMNDALKFYKNEPKVWHVSGYTPPLKGIKQHFFIKPTTCWGWATWDDRWIHFKKDTKNILNKFDEKRISDFNMNKTYDYYSHIVLNHDNKINTWAIFWYATSYFNNGLSLHPKKSFVQNIGHDGSGTHCGDGCSFDVQLSMTYENTFPCDISIKKEVTDILESYYKRLKLSFLKRSINKIVRIIKGKKNDLSTLFE